VAIGALGGGLAAAIVILGTTVAPLSVHFSPQVYATLGGPRPFLATMFVQMLLFGALVGIGLVYRRRPEIHRPMMLLATIVIQSGSLGRFPHIGTLAGFPPLYVWGPLLLFGGLLFVLQWNEQNPESVVFDGLRRDGHGVLPVSGRGQHRALEPEGQCLRPMKTSASDYHFLVE